MYQLFSVLDESGKASSGEDITSLVLIVLLGILLSFLLAQIFIHTSQIQGNKKQLAINFVLLTLTTTIIIYVIKSSISLSLGLVGALSIVRFRTAIKEPEELIFLFGCITLGICLGAHFISVAIVFWAFLSILALFKKKFFGHYVISQGLVINYLVPNDNAALIENDIIKKLQDTKVTYSLRLSSKNLTHLEQTLHVMPKNKNEENDIRNFITQCPYLERSQIVELHNLA